MVAGQGGLLHATTGAGKTYAVALGALLLAQALGVPLQGSGFQADALFDELRRAWSYRALPREAFQWALDFVVQGGASLGAYPEYHRVAWVEGAWRVPDCGVAQRHRLLVGTSVGEPSMLVKWWSQAGSGGGTLGQVAESFIARLKPGDCFVLGGQVLEFVRTQHMAAFVRKAVGKRGIVPAWAGGKMALSSELAEATRAVLAGVAQDSRPAGADEPELQAAGPMLDAQRRQSALPAPGARRPAAGATGFAPGPSPLRLPLCRPPFAPGPGQPAGLAPVAAAAQQLQHQRQ